MSAAGTGIGSPVRNGKQEEEVLYTVDDVVISTTTARFGSTLYSMNNINAVQIDSRIYDEWSHWFALAAIFTGIFLVFIFFDVTRVLGVISLVLAIWSFFIGKKNKNDARPIYYVSISTSGGNVAARKSEDKEYIFGIVCAIQGAMQKGVKAYT